MLGEQANQLKKLIESTKAKAADRREFLRQAEEGRFTRDENPKTHFCVYFAGYCPESRQVFIGLHKKSGLWLFNGGHLGRGEFPDEALVREIKEEWGDKVKLSGKFEPQLLTVTKIENPTKQP